MIFSRFFLNPMSSSNFELTSWKSPYFLFRLSRLVSCRRLITVDAKNTVFQNIPYLGVFFIIGVFLQKNGKNFLPFFVKSGFPIGECFLEFTYNFTFAVDLCHHG